MALYARLKALVLAALRSFRYYTKENLPFFLSKAHQEAFALAVQADIMTSETVKPLLAKANAQAETLSGMVNESAPEPHTTNKKEETKEPEEKEEKKEEAKPEEKKNDAKPDEKKDNEKKDEKKGDKDDKK